MGIFTNTLNEGYRNEFYNAEADLYDGDFTNEQQIGMDESYDLNFTEQAIYAVAENSKFYYNTMKQIGIAELAYFEANGKEMVYEAVDLSSLGEKIKNIFKKIIEKVKHLFHMFIARLSKIFGDNKNFVNKYRTEFVKGWSNLSDSASINGYKYTISTDKTATAETKDNIAEIFTKDTIGGDLETILKVAKNDFDKDNSLKDDTAETDKFAGGAADAKKTEAEAKDADAATTGGKYQTLVKKMNEKSEEIREACRSWAATTVVKFGNSTKGNDVPKSLTEKEMHEEVFSAFRNGETSKQKLEIKDIYGDASTVMNQVTDFGKIKEIVTKYTTHVTNASTKISNSLSTQIKNVSKDIKGSDGASTLATHKAAFISKKASIGSDYCNDMVKCLGILATALKDRTAQAKSVMVKLISGSKKYTEESYQYGNDSESTNSGSILDRVTIL